MVWLASGDRLLERLHQSIGILVESYADLLVVAIAIAAAVLVYTARDASGSLRSVGLRLLSTWAAPDKLIEKVEAQVTLTYYRVNWKWFFRPWRWFLSFWFGRTHSRFPYSTRRRALAACQDRLKFVNRNIDALSQQLSGEVGHDVRVRELIQTPPSPPRVRVREIPIQQVAQEVDTWGGIGQLVRLRHELEGDALRLLLERVVDAALIADRLPLPGESWKDERPRKTRRPFFEKIYLEHRTAGVLSRFFFPKVFPARVIIETFYPEVFLRTFGTQADANWFGVAIEFRRPTQPRVTIEPSPAGPPHEASPRYSAQHTCNVVYGLGRTDPGTLGGVAVLRRGSDQADGPELFFACDHSISPGCRSVVWSLTHGPEIPVEVDGQSVLLAPDLALLVRTNPQCAARCTDRVQFMNRRARRIVVIGDASDSNTISVRNAAAVGDVFLPRYGTKNPGRVVGERKTYLSSGKNRLLSIGKSVASERWIRFPTIDIQPRRSRAFSRRGDSGAWVVDRADGWLGIITEGPTKNRGESLALQAQFVAELVYSATKLGLLRDAGIRPADLLGSGPYDSFSFFSLEGAVR